MIHLRLLLYLYHGSADSKGKAFFVRWLCLGEIHVFLQFRQLLFYQFIGIDNTRAFCLIDNEILFV